MKLPHDRNTHILLSSTPRTQEETAAHGNRQFDHVGLLGDDDDDQRWMHQVPDHFLCLSNKTSFFHQFSNPTRTPPNSSSPENKDNCSKFLSWSPELLDHSDDSERTLDPVILTPVAEEEEDHECPSQKTFLKSAIRLQVESKKKNKKQKKKKTPSKKPLDSGKSNAKGTTTTTTTKKAKTVRFASDNHNNNNNNNNESNSPMCTVHWIPCDNNYCCNPADIWWTEKDADDCLHQVKCQLDELRRNDTCVELIEKIIHYRNPKNIEKTLQKLQKLFPEASGVERHISPTYQELCLLHRHFVLDMAQQVHARGLGNSVAGTRIIRRSSTANSRELHRLARKFKQDRE